MTKTKILMLSIFSAFLLFTSCTKEEDPKPEVIIESQVLAEYLESTNSPLGKDFVNTEMPSIISATEVNSMNLLGTIYIIDIRSATDYATGHVANAINVPIGDVLDHVETTDLAAYEKIAIICYTGQSAAWITSILRIMGHSKAYSMGFGMCSWNVDFAGGWLNSVANTYATQFTTDATAKGEAGDMPTLTTGKTTGQDILDVRVDDLITEGFSEAAISSSVVFGALDNYYIINYWGESDYSTIGHIPGAIQYTPKESINTTADLKTIPTDKTVVVYCWTGQTSSYLTAYLRLLGYDAKTLKFGANGMIYDVLTSHKFTEASIMGYEYETK